MELRLIYKNNKRRSDESDLRFILAFDYCVAVVLPSQVLQWDLLQLELCPNVHLLPLLRIFEVLNQKGYKKTFKNKRFDNSFYTTEGYAFPVKLLEDSTYRWVRKINMKGVS